MTIVARIINQDLSVIKFLPVACLARYNLRLIVLKVNLYIQLSGKLVLTMSLLHHDTLIMNCLPTWCIKTRCMVLIATILYLYDR